MKILGIHDGHNASACLLADGNIRFAIQEERLRREKNFAGFPSKSIELILRKYGLALDDIDCFALVGQAMQDQNTRQSRLALYREFGQPGYRQRIQGEQRKQEIYDCILPPRVRRRITAALGRPVPDLHSCGRLAQALAFGIPSHKIMVVEHHLAHAAAAYYGYGKYDRDVLILTNDGEGDGLCATVSMGRDGRIERLASVPRSESIGNLYSVVTFMMGMVPLEHEYKLMGMAPYADRKQAEKAYDKLAKWFTFDGAGPLGWKRADGRPDLLHSYSQLRDLFELDRFDSICGGLQLFTERMLVTWARNCLRETGARHVALSGGVFMNVKLNQAIMELPEVQDLFVFPSCGDESNAIGAAYWAAANRQDPKQLSPIRDLYLGQAFGELEVIDAINDFAFAEPVRWERHDDIEAKVAELLASGEIVARFCGREEFGARALGNRSILADPSNTDAIKIINKMIKCRDFWMPFATSMTDRQAAECLINPKHIAAPYMIMTFDTTERISDFKAGAHPQDLTVRPQVVYQDWSPDYYRLIDTFELLSGKRGGVLNTSLNLHGHPLVSSPHDALDVFNRSGLNCLAIENYLLQKESKISHEPVTVNALCEMHSS